MLKKLIEYVMQIILRFFNTVKQNWLYLILAFIAPLLLYYVGQGFEIMQYLIDKDQWLNILLALVSFIVLFYAIWVIPIWSIDISFALKKLFKEKISLDERGVFKHLAILYNGQQDLRQVFPIRKFANIPLLVFCYMLMVSQWQALVHPLYFFIILIISNIIIESNRKWFNQQYVNIFNGIPFYGYFGHLFFIASASCCWAFGFYWPGIIFIWLLFIYNDFFQFVIEDLSSEEGTMQQHMTKRNVRVERIHDFFQKSKNVYAVFISFICIALIVCTVAEWYDQMHLISPVFIMNICFTFYIATIDLILKTPKDIFYVLSKFDGENDPVTKGAHIGPEYPTTNLIKKNKLLLSFNFMSLLITFAAVFTIFFKSINEHKMHKERTELSGFDQRRERLDLDEYFKAWCKEKNIDSTSVVCLAIAPGGGSRAGYWTGLNLDSLSTKDVTLKERLFAISTVSGSSSGTNMLLTKWMLDKKGITPEVEEKKGESKMVSFWKKLYHFNYLSSGLWGLLISDGIRGWFTKKADFDKDRNYYHEMDELYALQKNYGTEHQNTIKNWMLGDYMLKWKKEENYALPIHIVNTATTQAGKRAVVCAYENVEEVHPTAIDLYQHFKEKTKTANYGFDLPMTTAVKVSQSFPVVSAYYHLDSVATFIDGGLYENTGANSMYELYVYLKEHNPNISFEFLFILNSDVDNPSTAPQHSVLTNTLSSVASTPFSGHSWYWLNLLDSTARKNEKGSAIKYIVPKDEEGKAIEFPLGIMLSSNTLDKMTKSIK